MNDQCLTDGAHAGTLPDNSEGVFNRSARSTVKSAAARASYQRQDVYELIDDLKLGHLGFVSEGRAVVIPITVWRVDDNLYFHTVNKSRLQKWLEQGNEFCISFAESTEWVLAKSAFRHSANYRSAVIYCTGERVVDDTEFDRAFEVIINQIEGDRWSTIRSPNKKERKATALLKLTINEGSFKSRSGGPNEEKEDIDLPVWHGVKPVCPFHK